MVEALLGNAAILLGLVLVLWVISLQIDDVSFIDSFWGGGMAVLALASWLRLAEPGPLANLIAAMTLLWGARLAIHLFRRWRREGEDPRYARMMRKPREQGRFASAALTKVFLGQAVLLFLVSSPAQTGILAAGATQPVSGLALAGFLLWLVGIVFEWVGDWQLASFRADKTNAGKVMDRGLWRYTRHPNYFGDACAWWGIWLAAASAGWWIAAATVIGPVFLTFTLTRWSGKPLLEAGLAKRRPGYADYVKRTSGFFPLPPRRGSAQETSPGSDR
jgi:steroid 5-alpha reductase family enzyme